MKVRIMSKLEAIQHTYKKEIAPCIIISINSFTRNEGDAEKPTFDKNPNIMGIKYINFDDVLPHQVEGLDYKPMSEEDAHEIVEFVSSFKQDIKMNLVQEIIVHCHAGISRSSAVASAICRYLATDDMWIWSNSYIPNRHVLETMNLFLGGKIYSYEEIERRYAINEAWREVDIFNLNEQLDSMLIKPNKGENK